MKQANTRKRNGLKNLLSLLMSVMMLLGSLSTGAATAEGTQYYNADSWVILAPTVVPTESAVPDGTLQTVMDDITFTVSPAADSAIFGAAFSADRVTDEAVLAAARAACTEALGADSVTDDTVLRLYQLHFAQNGETVAVPANLSVSASASTQSGFTPARAVALDWQGDAAALGEFSGVDRTNDQWQTTVVLPNTDMILFATRASGATPEPTATPAAGTYTFEDGSISLTATVGGSLPPEGATFFAESLGDVVVPAQGADGSALRSLLSYHIGFRTPEGELGTDAPLSVHLDVHSDAVAAATLLTNAQGDVLWGLPQGETSNSTRSFDFSLPVGNSFVLAGPEQAAEPTPAAGPKTFTYEDDTLRLNVTVPDAAALPEGAELTAAVAPAVWADYADRLAAQGLAEENLKTLLTLSAAFLL